MPINAAKALPSMGVATLPKNSSSSATVLPERSKLLSSDGPKLMRDTGATACSLRMLRNSLLLQVMREGVPIGANPVDPCIGVGEERQIVVRGSVGGNKRGGNGAKRC